jgi:hypothetical protein
MLSLAFALLLSTTGALLGVNSLALALYQRTELAPFQERKETRSLERAPLQEVLTEITRRTPGRELFYLLFPGAQFGIADHYVALVRDTQPTHEPRELLLVNARTAQVSHHAPIPLPIRLLFWAETLHTGAWGGTPLLVLWSVLSLATLGVSVLGVVSAALRTRERKAAA